MSRFYDCQVNFFSSDSPTNVTGVKVKGGKISWNKLTFINCKPKHKFNILFKNESTSIFKHTTNNTSFLCDSRCTKATMFDIWAVVDGVNWTVTNFPLNVTNFPIPKVDGGELCRNFFCQVRLLFHEFYDIIIRKKGIKCIFMRIVTLIILG